MNDIDTNELRRLAEAATPGPWKAEKYGIIGAGDRDVVSWDYALNDTDRGSEGTDKEFIAAANPTTILSLLDRLAAMTERAEKAEANYSFMVKRAADEKLDGYRELGARAAAAETRAEKAERDLVVLRECTVAERDRIHGYEMAKLRAELARRTIERDSHCEHANQESARASDYAESNESLRTALAGAEATIAKLREAMPSDDERDAIECAILDDADSFERQCVREWLARFDAARGGAK